MTWNIITHNENYIFQEVTICGLYPCKHYTNKSNYVQT